MLKNNSDNEINGLFKVCHFFKIAGMVRCVAAFIACRIYIPLNLQAYNDKMAELKIKKQLTNEVSQEYRNKYTFLWSWIKHDYLIIYPSNLYFFSV